MGANGHERSSTVQRTARSPAFRLMQLGDVGRRFGLWSRRFGSAPSGSRRAATGVRNDRGARSKTVENHDRRSCYRRPLTWHFLRVFPVLNTTQFLAGMTSTDLARRKSWSCRAASRRLVHAVVGPSEAGLSPVRKLVAGLSGRRAAEEADPEAERQ